MINEGMKNLAAGANPIILRKGMKKATDKADVYKRQILGYARLNEDEIVRGTKILMEAFSNEKDM